MNQTAMDLLEYEKIKERLCEYALSESARERIRKMEPHMDLTVIRNWMDETTEARAMVDRSASVPLYSLNGIEKVMGKIGKGGQLHPEDLAIIASLLEGGRRVKGFMAERGGMAPRVASYALSIEELGDLREEILRCIRNSQVDDKASAQLSKTRKKIGIVEDRIKSKLDSILRSSTFQDYIQDSVVSIRGGRYVIPVKKEHRRNMEGNVMDTSASGSTVFVEPAAVRKLQEELNLLRLEEEQEVYRILSYLTGLVESHHRELTINIETMVHYDFLFAKAKYSKALEGNPVDFNMHQYICLKGAKHPLIGRDAVPLDFTMGKDYRALVITGPNTGGKTVALKTVGLLTMMAQSGMHIPVKEGSEAAIFRDILVDIGDGQSIEQSLSTFSSHIRNIISIVACADHETLVILDELGAGTDPGEGMGIAVAVLEEVHRTGAALIATTHYSEIKDFASSHEGFENGCMEFDINTLKPLYRLKIGQSGESNAFLIALRLGMSTKLIERAHEVTYKEKRSYIDAVKVANEKPLQNTEVITKHAKQVEKSQQVQEIKKAVEKRKTHSSFNIGDCVYISSLERTGIVCELEDSKGDVGVMVMKKKLKVNHKRLKLYVEGSELYPEEYDMSIVLESKDNRRKRKMMSKHHVEGVSIET